MQIKALKGIKDILPDNIHLWHLVENTAREFFFRYGFKEIKIPVLEKTELFVRSIGEDTDIVEKEMYSFKDKGGDEITLRPEGTASVVRAFIEHKFYSKQTVSKFYYSGPMFRRERPQAGRFRQFYQIGAEAFGTENSMIDAELISMLSEYLNVLIRREMEVHINTLGCTVCRKKFLNGLKEFFKDNLNKLCVDCNRRYNSNPLRILDCKVTDCISIVEGTPISRDYICNECKDHFETLINYLGDVDVRYTINNKLVRGLDYYTRTAFEIVDNNLGTQNAVAGGGRYDNLVKAFGGPSVPAVGFAIGVERLVSLLDQDFYKSKKTSSTAFLISLGEASFKKSFEITSRLRKEGINIERSYDYGSLKSQMRKANKQNSRFALLLGDNEIATGNIILKDMADGKQEEVKMENIVEYIKALLLTHK